MIALGVKIIELHDRFWDSIDNYFDDCDFEDFLEGVKEDFYKAIIWLKNNQLNFSKKYNIIYIESEKFKFLNQKRNLKNIKKFVIIYI